MLTLTATSALAAEKQPLPDTPEAAIDQILHEKKEKPAKKEKPVVCSSKKTKLCGNSCIPAKQACNIKKNGKMN